MRNTGNVGTSLIPPRAGDCRCAPVEATAAARGGGGEAPVTADALRQKRRGGEGGGQGKPKRRM